MFGASRQVWYDAVTGPSITVTGGYQVVTGGSTFYVFETSGTLTVSGGTVVADIWVIGGGGGGDVAQSPSNYYVGGGNAGQRLRYTSSSLTPSTYTVTVGAGGASGYTGGSSQFGSYTAATGGADGSVNSGATYTPTAAVTNPWSINNSALGGFYYSGTNYYGGQGGWGQCHYTGAAHVGGMPNSAGGGNGLGTSYGVEFVAGGGTIYTMTGYANSGGGSGGWGGQVGYPYDITVLNGGSGIVIVKV